MYRRSSMRIVSIVKSRFQTLSVGSLLRSACSESPEYQYWTSNLVIVG